MLSKLKKFTENKYTLSDIFIKNNEIILMIPLMLYLFYPFVHMVSYSLLYRELSTLDDLSHLISVGEMPGNYFIPIVDFMMILGAFFALIAVISYIIKQKQNPIKAQKSDYIPLLFFICICILMIVSTVVNGGISNNLLFGYTQRGEGLVSLFIYLLVYYLCGSLIKNEKYKYVAIYTYLSVSLCVGLTTLVDEYLYDIPIIDTTGVSGIFRHFNFYAYFLTIAILLSAGLVLCEKIKRRRIFAFLMFILNTVMLVLTNTMGCFLACIVAFVFMIVAATIKNKKFSFGSLILFVIFLAICFILSLWTESFFTQLLGVLSDAKAVATDPVNSEDAGTARWGLWKETIGYIKDRPLIGYGFEGTCEMLNEATGQDKVHNEYLNWAADFGIPCALLYIGGLISIFIKALKNRAKVDGASFCCLVASMGYIGSAFFGNNIVYIIPFFFIFLGLSNSYTEIENNNIFETENNDSDIENNYSETENDTEPLNDELLIEN